MKSCTCGSASTLTGRVLRSAPDRTQKAKTGIREDSELATSVVPLTDHIVLQTVKDEEVTTSGLVIPDSAKEKPQHGLVVSVGPGKLNDNGVVETLDLDDGDRVLYQKYTGQDITVDKTDYIIIRFQDVLAKLVDGK